MVLLSQASGSTPLLLYDLILVSGKLIFLYDDILYIHHRCHELWFSKGAFHGPHA